MLYMVEIDHVFTGLSGNTSLEGFTNCLVEAPDGTEAGLAALRVCRPTANMSYTIATIEPLAIKPGIIWFADHSL